LATASRASNSSFACEVFFFRLLERQTRRRAFAVEQFLTLINLIQTIQLGSRTDLGPRWRGNFEARPNHFRIERDHARLRLLHFRLGLVLFRFQTSVANPADQLVLVDLLVHIHEPGFDHTLRPAPRRSRCCAPGFSR
jgi:hypothetical protein